MRRLPMRTWAAGTQMPYDFWRLVTAIQEAAINDHPDTQLNQTFTLLGFAATIEPGTPNFTPLLPRLSIERCTLRRHRVQAPARLL